MKIIVANYRYFIAGGPEKYMFNFIKAAKKREIEVIPFSVNNPQNEYTPYSEYFAKPRSKELLYADTKKNFSNFVGIVRATTWNYDASKRIKKLIRDTKPDAVYILHEVNHLSPSIIRAAKREGIRVFHRISDFFMFCPKYDFLCENDICESCIHGNYSKALKKCCVKGSWFGTVLRVFAMILYKKIKVFEDVDQYVCTCQFSMNKLIEGGIPKSKITCVPTFIDFRKIVPNYEHNKYFLFLGRMAHQKGTIYAIEAMKWIKDTEYVLKITGTITDSDYDQKVWEYIKQHQLQSKIFFTGFVHDEKLEDLIANATCVLCPAIWYENMPNTVIEAYAHGKPVIASRIGSLAEIVIDNETGLLFEPRNAYDLSQCMRKFIEDKNLSFILGHNARNYCEKNFSETSHMNKLISIFKDEL